MLPDDWLALLPVVIKLFSCTLAYHLQKSFRQLIRHLNVWTACQ